MHVKTRSLGTRMALRAGAVLTLVAGSLVATATSASAVAATLNVSHGPSGGGYTIVLTEAVANTMSVAQGAITVEFNSAGTCGAYVTPVALTNNAGAAQGVVAVTGLTAPANNVSTLTVTVPVGMTLPAGSGSTTFSVCAYDAGNNNGALVGADAAFTLNPDATPTPATGAPGGGYSIVVNPNTANFTGSPTVQFQAKIGANPLCSATSAAPLAPTTTSGALTGGVVAVPAANVTVNATDKLTVLVPPGLVQPTTPALTQTGDYLVCVYTANGQTLLAEESPATPFTVSGNVVLSQTTGAAGTTPTVTLSAPAAVTGTIFTSADKKVYLLPATSACPAAATGQNSAAAVTNSVAIAAASVRYVSGTKIAVTLPNTLTAGAAYKVCAYDNAGTTLLATANSAYTPGTVPTISTVTPATGPAQGGGTITVTGANFPQSGMTATLGGTPLTNITLGTVNNGVTGTFTATIPAHAPGGPFPLVVTTSGGPATASNVFTYTNGITVSPRTAPNTSMLPTGLDITGVGFEDLNFSSTYSTNSTSPHVYLVKGVYNPTSTGGTTPAKVNPQTAECVDVLVINDNNLICNLYLGGNLTATPTPTTRTLTGCTSYANASAVPPATAPSAQPTSATAYIGPNTSVITTCSFTQADVGQTITAGTAIPANATTIIAVSNNGIATLSKAAASVVTTTTTGITESNVRTLSDGSTTQIAATLNTATVANQGTWFTQADVGKLVVGAQFPTGTYIMSVSNQGVATLSNTAAATSTTTSYSIFAPAPVPNGTYTVTIVSNGALGAVGTATNPWYQSIISSGSTFTVADYLHH